MAGTSSRCEPLSLSLSLGARSTSGVLLWLGHTQDSLDGWRGHLGGGRAVISSLSLPTHPCLLQPERVSALDTHPLVPPTLPA